MKIYRDLLLPATNLLKEKCEQAWVKLKNRNQPASEFLSISGFSSSVKLRQAPIIIEGIITSAAREELKAAYDCLDSVLKDFHKYNLLCYKPLLDKHGSEEISLKVRETISSWSQIYSMFTLPQLEEIPAWMHEIRDLLKHDLHRQLQSLPACLLYKIPLFPDLTTVTNKKDGVEEMVSTINKTADFLGETFEKWFCRKDAVGAEALFQELVGFPEDAPKKIDNI